MVVRCRGLPHVDHWVTRRIDMGILVTGFEPNDEGLNASKCSGQVISDTLIGKFSACRGIRTN